MPETSNRLSTLPQYIFSIIGDRIRAMTVSGIDVFRLDIGNPDMPPPDAVVDALAQSASKPGHHGYTGYRGLASFRQAVAEYYRQRFGVTVDPDTQILPVIGSKEGIINLTLAYIDRGDLALVPDIGYPSYAMGTRLAGGDVAWMSLREEHAFLPQFHEIERDIAQRAKLLWVNYPNNPTGAIADQSFYENALRFCQQNDILLVSDNPYVDVTFDGYQAGSVLQIQGATNHAIEFMSMSKSFNMAGWRIGAAVGSSEAIRNLLHVKSNVDSGHFQPIYDAGSVALSVIAQDWIDERNQIYAHRRDQILEALPQIGLQANKSHGSLYVWARAIHMNSQDYVDAALQEAYVSLAPGIAYGPGGTDYIRISIAVPDERLTVALERLKSWYATKQN